MASLRVTVQVDLDGVPATWLAPNGRIVRRYEVDESQSFSYSKATEAAATIPSGQLDTIQEFILVPEGEMSFYIDGSATPIVIGANGVLLALGATVDAAAATNITVANAGSAAILKGIVAGT